MSGPFPCFTCVLHLVTLFFAAFRQKNPEKYTRKHEGILFLWIFFFLVLDSVVLLCLRFLRRYSPRFWPSWRWSVQLPASRERVLFIKFWSVLVFQVNICTTVTSGIRQGLTCLRGSEGATNPTVAGRLSSRLAEQGERGIRNSKVTATTLV